MRGRVEREIEEEKEGNCKGKKRERGKPKKLDLCVAQLSVKKATELKNEMATTKRTPK